MSEAEKLIRNVRFANQIKKGKVAWQVFKPDSQDRGSGLSVTRTGNRIQIPDGLDDYQAVACLHSDGLLGVCVVAIPQVESISLVCVPEPLKGHDFSDLHALLQNPFESDLCPSEGQQRQLALFATENGLARPMKPTSTQ